MRKFRAEFQGGRAVVNADAVNIKYVTQVVGIVHKKRRKRRRKFRKGFRQQPMHQVERADCRQPGRNDHKKPNLGRPPKLLRFYASCGMLDRHVAARMSNGEIMEDAARGLCYSARGLASSLSEGAGGVARAASGLGKLVALMFGWRPYRK